MGGRTCRRAFVTRHLLVTNDFPPKHGGIQSYLWELWRRLPPDETTVLTTSYPGAPEWDATQPFRVVRMKDKVLFPLPRVAHAIDALASDVGASVVMLDPALPIGLVGPRLGHRYGVVLHGAEITVPGRIPGSHAALRRVLCGARVVISAGGYPLAEAERAAGCALPATNVPPGVDVDRFRPLTPRQRREGRARLGLPLDGRVVLGLSRLVPRKGFDVLLRAAARLRDSRPDLVIAIAGGGRDRTRLERLANDTNAPVQFLGRVDDQDLPTLYGCADVFAMLCRNRWFGLEQEGFGIVFLEAAAAGVAAVAGASGGAAEAVEDGVTGFVVDPPDELDAVTAVLRRLLDDATLRERMGAAARARAVDQFAYDVLAARLQAALDGVEA